MTLESLPDRLPDVLSFMGTNVVPTTRLTMIIRNDRKAEFGWSKDFMNGIERYCSRLPFRHVPCLPPRLRLTHALQTPESCPERRIAHCRACVRTQTPFRENDSADRSHEAEVRRCRNVNDITIYVAVYNSDKTLKSIKIVNTFNAEAGDENIEKTIENVLALKGDTVRPFVWNLEQKPLATIDGVVVQ